MFNLLCPKRSIHKIAVALVLQPCKCQALVFLVRNKSDTPPNSSIAEWEKYRHLE